MTILITGATRGIGRGLFDHYVAAGEDVVGTYRGPPPTDSGRWQALDVADPASCTRLAAAYGDRPLDLLICNAGVYLDRGHSLPGGFGPELWEQTFAVNVTGVFGTITALLPNLRKARGKVAIISSNMGSSTTAAGGSYIYRSSKAAVLNLGRNLAVDLKPDGIAVGIYHPGWVITDMGTDAAMVTVTDSVAGLTAQFADLSLEKTGCFEDWTGEARPF